MTPIIFAMTTALLLGQARPIDLLPPVVAQQSAERLAQALQFETVSTPTGPKSPESFLAFHKFLATTYPHVHKTLQYDVVADYSLLFYWPGSDTSSKPALLLAHQDVVPVDAETLDDWTHPPFSGTIDDGVVWGRGAMDFKFGVIAILEAAEKLLAQGFKPRQSLYLGFTHDEEVLGQSALAMVRYFRERQIELDWVLDEGLIIAHDMFPGLAAPLALVGLAEKGFLSVELEAVHPGGHSSMPPPQSAAGIIARAVTKLEDNPMPQRITAPVKAMLHRVGDHMPWAQSMVFKHSGLTAPLLLYKLAQKPNTNALTRTTTAVTMLKGSPQDNVLPNRARAVVNFRILPGDTTESVLQHVREVVDDERVLIRPYKNAQGENPSKTSCVDCASFSRIEKSIAALHPNAVVAPSILIAATDSRHFQEIAQAIFRFSPQEIWPKDMSGFHGVNEKTGVAAFGRAIQFYMLLMRGD